VWIDERNAVAEVDEGFLTGPMRLTQHHREAFLEALVQLSKLRVRPSVTAFLWLARRRRG
jgi:hypothetical protein